MNENTNRLQPRSREEITAWLQRAKQRKLAWEERTIRRMEERAALRSQVAASHYYDIEWS